MTALAKSYEQLGFRVIEGGKSGKIAILKTPAIEEIFGERHKNVLRRIRRYREQLGSNLSPIFTEHCRDSTYRVSRGSPERECFELTKEGFVAIAGQYDPRLSFLCTLLFGAVERNDYTIAGFVEQINARIRELRFSKAGQHELFDDGSDQAVEDDDLDDAEARAIWHARVTQEPMPRWHRQTWEETEDGTSYDVILRHNPDDSSYLLRIVRANAVAPLMARIPVADGHTSLLCLEENTPHAVIKRALMRLPKGRMTEIGMATIDHFLAD